MINDPFKQREAQKYDSPIPSREYILKYIEELKKPAKLQQLITDLKLKSNEEQTALHRRLRAMEREGQLIFTRQKCYVLPQKLAIIKGTVIAHHDGYGFLNVEGTKTDYFISFKQMKNILYGDKVLAQPINVQSKSKCEVRIIRVIEERSPKIIGRYFNEAGISYVMPDDKRLNFDILIIESSQYQPTMGAVVCVELIKRPLYRQKAVGKIIEVIGDMMNTNIAIDVALRKYEIPYTLPDALNAELTTINNTVTTRDKINRIDLTHLPLITIDGEDARDFDDAVYCKKQKTGGFKLWVAIADVSHYVKVGSMLDKSAYERSTSVYFPSKVIPMLPEVLSNGLCSLNPHVERLSLVCEIAISKSGNITTSKFYEAVINSHARLTYNKVQQMLDGDETLCKQYEHLIADIRNLYSLYKLLELKRNERGAINFETHEPKFIFNHEKTIEKIETIKRNDAHKIIEECMILANVAAAKLVTKNKAPCLFRIHDKPDQEKLTQLKSILSEKGINLSSNKALTTKDIAALIDQLASRPDYEQLQTHILRSMKQAVYDPINKGHFGLALNEYAHFTSPIRRYPDLLLHRVIKSIISNKTNIKIESAHHYNLEQMLVFAEHCSMAERRADEAVRDVVDWLKCHYMKDHIGEIFTGVISGVKNFGFFVRLDELYIDGMVHVSTLDNDYYIFDEIKSRLVGEVTKFSYKLGDKVQICVQAVNEDEKKIDFKLISSNNRVKRKAKSKSKVKKA